MKPYIPTAPAFEDQERALRALAWAEKAHEAAAMTAQLLCGVSGGAVEWAQGAVIVSATRELAEKIRERIAAMNDGCPPTT
jgi:hypothetical protein